MRLQETLNMLKSAIIFNIDRIPLKFIIITETAWIANFKDRVQKPHYNQYTITFIIAFTFSARRLVSCNKKHVYI